MDENEATNATNTAQERRGEPASGVADSRDGLIDRPPARETTPRNCSRSDKI